MKKSNFNAKFSIIGYFLFLLPLTITVAFGIKIFYELYSKNFSHLSIAIYLILYIVFATLLFTLMDIIRRRNMVDKPVKQILEATQRMSKGDFFTKIIPLHSYYKYDEYDLIMDNLNIMAQELSKSEILKKEFISNVSHEIKTPLSVISNYAKALQKKDLDEKTTKKYLETLVITSKKLSNLITNILKLNKLENQSIKASKENINIGEILRENILQFENLLENKKINLNCKITDIILLSEESYFEIIFNNLISNAIKFTDKGGKIDILLENQNEEVVFKVKDNGCGMNTETGEHIFEKFYQGDTSHSNEGNGLGLALVKKIIDIMGGEISVSSEEGKGSTFTIKLKRNTNE